MGMAEKDLNKGAFAPPALGSGEFLAYPELEDERGAEAISTDKIEDVLQKLGGLVFEFGVSKKFAAAERRRRERPLVDVFFSHTHL